MSSASVSLRGGCKGGIPGPESRSGLSPGRVHRTQDKASPEGRSQAQEESGSEEKESSGLGGLREGLSPKFIGVYIGLELDGKIRKSNGGGAPEGSVQGQDEGVGGTGGKAVADTSTRTTASTIENAGIDARESPGKGFIRARTWSSSIKYRAGRCNGRGSRRRTPNPQ